MSSVNAPRVVYENWIEVEGLRATPIPSKEAPTDWRITKRDPYTGSWKDCGSIPAISFPDGYRQEILRNMAEGKKFGAKLTDPVEARRELLEGGDLTCSVSPPVRELVAEEYDAGGTFKGSVECCAHQLWPDLSRETFARLCDEPGPVEEKSISRDLVQKWADKLAQAPNWETARDLAIGDQWFAGLCSASLLSWLHDEYAMDDAPNPKAQEQKLELAKELFGEESPEAEAVSAGLALVESDLGNWKRGIDLLEAPPANVLGDAMATAASINDAMAVLGCGDSSGTHSRVAEPPSKIRELLRAAPKFRELVRLAGRMRAAAQESRRTKTNYVPEEIVDVTLGGEIGRMLPTELMMLSGADTENQTLRRLSERQCLEYSLRGRERQQQGPILVAVDASGSMDGPRRDWASAVALTLLESCAREGRPMAWCWFDTRIAISKLWINPRVVPIAELMAMACYQANGGTSLKAPLDWAAKNLAGKWEKADLVLVSDGCAEWGKAEAKKLHGMGCRLFGVSIDSDWPAEAVKDMDGGVLAVSQQQIANGETKLDLLWRI